MPAQNKKKTAVEARTIRGTQPREWQRDYEKLTATTYKRNKHSKPIGLGRLLRGFFAEYGEL